jgi:hypothetical protein
MGIETILKAVAAPLIGGLLGKSGSKQTAPATTSATQNVDNTTTSKNQLDPRIEAMLFGDSKKRLKAGAVPQGTDLNGQAIYAPEDYEVSQKGLLSQFSNLANQKQSQGLATAGQSADDYLKNFSAEDMNTLRDSAMGLLQGKEAPRNGFYNPITAATSANPAGQVNLDRAQNYKVADSSPSMSSSGVNAPSQNNLDLSGAYNSFINGESGNNPFLTGAIGKGINQSKTAFENMQTDATRNLTENVLPNVRSSALASGGFGGSRQGIAEARGLQDFSTQMGRAVSQFGQNNTDAAVAAQSGQYGQDQANKLNALNTLSGQQYGVAGQNASLASQAAQMAQQNNQFNAGQQNQAASQQYQGDLSQNLNQANFTSDANKMNQQNNQFNAGQKQQANITNNQSLLNNSQFNTNLQQQNNQLNQAGQLAGMNALNNQFGNNLNLSNANNNYDFNQAQKMGSLLNPYLNIGATNTSNIKGTTAGTNSTPQYTNPTANFLGGAAAGKGIYDMFSSGFGGNSSPAGGFTAANGYENYGGTPTYSYGGG